VIQRLAATNPQEEAVLEVEWGRYRIQPLSVDVTGEGIMANLTHKTTDPKTNRVVLAPVRDRRMWWANFMAQNGFPLLAKAARRLRGQWEESYGVMGRKGALTDYYYCYYYAHHRLCS
jgi:hypothetical protein